MHFTFFQYFSTIHQLVKDRIVSISVYSVLRLKGRECGSCDKYILNIGFIFLYQKYIPVYSCISQVIDDKAEGRYVAAFPAVDFDKYLVFSLLYVICHFMTEGSVATIMGSYFFSIEI